MKRRDFFALSLLPLAFLFPRRRKKRGKCGPSGCRVISTTYSGLTMDWDTELAVVSGRWKLTGDKHWQKVVVHKDCELDATDFTGQIDELVIIVGGCATGLATRQVGVVAYEDEGLQQQQGIPKATWSRTVMRTNPIFMAVTKTA